MFIDIDYSRKAKEAKLHLAKPNKKIISIIHEKIKDSVDLKFGDINELEFSIPFKIENRETGELIHNKHTDLIKEKMLIKLTLGEYQEWFVIKDISEDSDNDDLFTVKAMSLGYELRGRVISSFVIDDPMNATNSMKKALERTPWKVGEVDQIFNDMARAFDINDSSVLDIINQIGETFGGILIWDTINKTLSLKDPERIGKFKGMTINYGRLLKSIRRERTSDEMVTRMYVEGGDGLSIHSVNPTGQGYIEDYSYFMYPFEMDKNGKVIKSSHFMSDDLCIALTNHEKSVEQHAETIIQLQSDLSDKENERATEETKLTELNNELDNILSLLDIAKSVEDNVAIEKRKEEKVDKEAEIVTQQSKVDSINEDIKTLNKRVEDLQEQISIDSGFNQELLDELNLYSMNERVWRDDRYTTAQDLFEGAVKEFEKLRQPKVVIDVDMDNLLNIVEEQYYWDKLVIGDLVKVKYPQMNIEYMATIIEINYNLEDGEANVVIANTKDLLDDTERLIEIIYKSSSSTTLLETSKHKWDKVNGIEKDITKLINSEWDATKNKIIAGVNNSVEVGNRGIIITNPTFPNEVIIMQSGVIALSEDGGDTWKTAIKPTGVIAERIIGRMILGEHLYIENDSGKLRFDNDGLTITRLDEKIKTFVNATDGIKIQRKFDSDRYEDVFYADADGILYARGLIIDETSTLGGYTVDEILEQTGGIVTDDKVENKIPNKVTGLVAEGLFETIQLSWDFNATISISHYEVHASQEINFLPSEETLVWAGKSDGYAHKAKRGQTWYFRVRAVNTHKIAGSYSDQATASTEPILSNDILFGEILAEHLQDNLDIADKLAQNTVDMINRGPIQQIQYTLEQIEEVESRLMTDLNTRIGDVNSSINGLKDTADGLKNRVDETDRLLSEQDGKISNLTRDVNEVEGLVRTTITSVEKIDGTVTSHTSTLSQHAEKIEGKLDSLTYTKDKEGLVNNIESNSTQISLLASGLELTVTKEEFEALSIVGRNYFVIKDAKEDTLLAWANGQESSEKGSLTSGFISVNTGEGFICSHSISQLFYYDSNKDYIPTSNMVPEYSFKIANMTPQVKYIRIVFRNNFLNGRKKEEVRVQLGKGNKITDWTPAPEDTEAEISSVRDRVSTTEATLEIQAEAISARVERSEVYTKSQIDTSLGKKLDTTIYTNKMSQLDTTIGGITGRVSSTETSINSLTGDMTTAKNDLSTLKIESGKIEQSVSKLETDLINSINLVKNPAKTGSAIGWNSNYAIEDFEGVQTGVIRNTSSSNATIYSDWFDVDPSKAYEITIWVRKSAKRGRFYFGVHGSDSKDDVNNVEFINVNIGNGGIYSETTNSYFQSGGNNATTTWQKLTGFLMPSGTPPTSMKNLGTGVTRNMIMKPNLKRVRIRILNYENDGINTNLFIAMPKVSTIAEGNVGRIASAESSITTLSNQIELKSTEINSIEGRLSTAESTLTVMPSQIDLAVTQGLNSLQIGGSNIILNSNIARSSTSYQVYGYYMSEDWETNTYYSVAIKGEINSGQAFGMWANGSSTKVASFKYDSELGLHIATFKTPSTINATTTKRAYVYNVPSTGVKTAKIEWIKLVKGNVKIVDWSPTLEEQVGVDNVLASINLSSEGVRISGNKIHLTGQTLIDSGIIGTASIANLAVTSAKIANLAVGTAEIANLAVTNAKIGALAVDNAKIANLAVTNAKIANATITDAKIASLSVSKLLAGEIDSAKIKIRGGSSTAYTLIDGPYFESRGKYTRTWNGATTTSDVRMMFENGYLRARNETKDWSLYFTDFGISTYADGSGGGVSSGTIEFFSYKYGNARGLTLYSFNGPVALNAENSKIVLDASDIVEVMGNNLRADGIAQREPYTNMYIGCSGTRNGEVRITDKEFSKSPIRYMPIKASEFRTPNGNAYINGSGGGTLNSGDRVITDGVVTSSTNMYLGVDGEVRITDKRGYNNGGAISYRDLRVRDILANSLRTTEPTANFYIGTGSNELRVTSNSFYNGGNTTYRDVRASNFYANGGTYYGTGGASITLRSDSTGPQIFSVDIYNRTYSGAPNMHVTDYGTLGRSTSALKYKDEVKTVKTEGYSERILQLNPKSWIDRTEKRENGGTSAGLRRHYGLIAEDVLAVGLGEFVSYGANSEVEGLEYDRLWTQLIPVVRDLKVNTEKDLNFLKMKNQLLEQRLNMQDQRIKHLEELLEVV